MVWRVMRKKNVRRMSLAELRHEQTLIPLWIRDVVTPKRARLREISKEIERRTGESEQ